MHLTIFFRYKEVCEKKYDFDLEDGAQGASRFTQMIWRNSNDFGIGAAKKRNADGRYCTYIVCRYADAGNFEKQYKVNIPRGKFDKSMCSTINQTALSAAKEFERSYIRRRDDFGSKCLVL